VQPDMGLDAVEFVLAVEDAFGLAIPNQDAARLLTPGDVVDYLERRLPKGSPLPCLEQRAFYRLRRACGQVLERSRESVQPETLWTDLLNEGNHSREWELLGRAAAIRPWPRLKPMLSFGPAANRVQDTVKDIVAHAPATLLDQSEGWDRPRIEAHVRRLMAEELGVTAFKWTDRFVQDLNVD
jgi:hypothetical protein